MKQRRERVFPWKHFSRIVLIQILLVLLSLGGAGLAARHFFKERFLGQVGTQLQFTLKSLERSIPRPLPAQWCARHASDPALRLTLIRPSGQVLCDSHHLSEKMENHLSRPEVQDALANKIGTSTRHSTTLNEDMVYGAVVSKEKDLILRGAIPLTTLRSSLRVLDYSLALFLLVLGALLTTLSIWAGRWLSVPIGRLLEEIGRERVEQAIIMSAISDGILAVDKEGVPLFYNSRFAVLFGSRENLNANLWEMFPEATNVLSAFQAALREGKSSSVTGPDLRQESGQRYFSLSVAPLRRPETEEVYGAVGVFHDVTELKLAEQIRIDFVANVSHELRTPLTSIKGYADTIVHNIETGRPVAREFAEVINRNTARLMNLINDLLDLSSLESNADDIAKNEVSTHEITARVLNQLQRAFYAKKQTVDHEEQIGAVVADPARLEQVLINLLDNASKYTPAGGRIRLVWAKDQDAVLLKVSDSGPGIPPEHHSRLFERFYRVDRARSRELGGTGLGLAIVKHIMQRHGGSVWVESSVGRGSTFICRFPNQHV